MIAPILEEFPNPPQVVAHSFGGRVALALEAERPSSFSAMVFTGVPLLRRQGGGRPSVGYRLLKAAHRLGVISADRMEAEKRTRGSADYRAVAGVMRDILVTVVNESYETELASLQTPLTLVWGADDQDVPTWIAERSVEMVPGPVSLTVIDDAGHFLPSTHPHVLRTALGITK
jgi:pimeloyl-ACP methyl ester carboxylesterase